MNDSQSGWMKSTKINRNTEWLKQAAQWRTSITPKIKVKITRFPDSLSKKIIPRVKSNTRIERIPLQPSSIFLNLKANYSHKTLGATVTFKKFIQKLKSKQKIIDRKAKTLLRPTCVRKTLRKH